MVAVGWVFLLAVSYLECTLTHNHSRDTDTYYVSAGHLFVLKCLIPDAHPNVTWSRVGRRNQSLPAGVEVRDGLLWFLPVQMSHDGSYACKKSDETGSLSMTFGVSVTSGECPDAPENLSVSQGVTGFLPCKQQEIFKLNETRNIRWMKDCLPVKRPGEPIFVDKNGFMRLPEATEEDAGKYTCLIDFTLDGRTYTAARSIQLTIDTSITGIVVEPELVYPHNEVAVVEVGTRTELKCLANLGPSEDNETSIFWTINGDFVEDLFEDFKEFSVSLKYTRTSGRVNAQSTLSISKVLHKFLNITFRCHVRGPTVEKIGVVWLQEADHSAFHTSLALCLAACLILLASAAAFLFCKVDVVLAYRKLLRHFSKQQAPDGKLYDAYVSFLHPDNLSSAETESFVMQVLPDELEKKHDYSLYIRGRDDCPGEAVHDVIAATLSQCRRLIIILSPDVTSPSPGKTEELPLCDNQNQLCYEQKIGLHDALTSNEPRVILVEIGGPVDYSCLPESLRYIQRRQGSLKWRKHSLQTSILRKKRSDKNFWKNLRYHMPSVPTGRCQTIF